MTDRNPDLDNQQNEIEPTETIYQSMPLHEIIRTINPNFTNTAPGRQGINDETLPRGRVLWIFEQVPRLPSFPIDRFSIAILCPAYVVAARLCESLRLRSVVAVYDGASAMCRTRSFLKYAIYLYEGPDEDSTTLEVIRYDGCGFEFRREREMVQAAARGNVGETVSNLPGKMKISEDSMLLNYKGPTKEELNIMICRSTERLQSESLEEKLFVLQHLCANTASEKVNYDSALLVSRLILANTFDICRIILSHLVEFSERCDDIGYQILSACLGIIANSMEVLADNLVLGDVLNTSIPLANDITETIITIIEKSPCPHNKAAALTCLRLILTNSKVRHDVIDRQTHDVLEKARLDGERYHLNLERAAQSILGIVGSI